MNPHDPVRLPERDHLPAPAVTTGRTAGVGIHTGTATAVMATSMFSLYAVSALAPTIAADLHLSRVAVGSLVTATFTVAAAASLVAGRIIDTVGARRGMAALAVLVTLALTGAAASTSFGWLLAALSVAGLGQALANPATNILLMTHIDGPARATAVGIKQSGVQLAAILAGLALPPIAAASSWRTGMAVSAIIPVAVLAAVMWLTPADVRRADVGAWWRLPRPTPWLGWLVVYSLLLGTALSEVTAYLPLYAAQRLAVGPHAAGAMVAAVGASGVVARVWWSRIAGRRSDVTRALPWLSLVAVFCIGLVWLAGTAWSWLVWVGAVGVGGSAVAANAICMLAVIRSTASAGHASGLVSLGFFSGFVLGPTTFGLLADHVSYAAAWTGVAAFLALSIPVGLRTRTGARSRTN